MPLKVADHDMVQSVSSSILDRERRFIELSSYRFMSVELFIFHYIAQTVGDSFACTPIP